MTSIIFSSSANDHCSKTGQTQLRQGEKSTGLGIRWPGFKLNPPLNSYDLGRVILTSQLSSCVTREYSLLHSLVVFRNEAMAVKAPGGKEERRGRRREGGGAGFGRGKVPSPGTQNRVLLRGLGVEQQLWGWTRETVKREIDRTRWQLGLASAQLKRSWSALIWQGLNSLPPVIPNMSPFITEGDG